MKKILLSAFFLFNLAGLACAQERILDFAVLMNVQTDGSVQIEESITVDAQHIKIRRGLYRDIPDSADNKVHVLSLQMDNEVHPYFLENAGRNLRINFGNDDFIARGTHTYTLRYTMTNVVEGFEDYDEIYWNITGNYWDFPIDHASLKILFPGVVAIRSKLISMYTGPKGSKASDAKMNKNFFETTRPLAVGEGFTVAVPFDKGTVQSHKKSRFAPGSALLLKLGDIKFSKTAMAGVLLFVILFVYYIFTWFAAGRDPKDVFVTEFAPPEGISPAFMRCLWTRRIDNKMFATALVSLAMKDTIEITEEKSLLQKTTTLKLKDGYAEDLFEEEEHILKTLFSSAKEFAINQLNWTKLSYCMGTVDVYLKKAKEQYIRSNAKYIWFAVIALILFQLLILLFGADGFPLVFINAHYCIFLFAFVGLPKNKIVKFLAFIFINLFYSVFFLGFGSAEFFVIEICFLLSAWGLLIYKDIIDNLTEEGRELFKRIKGFHRYMTIAEEHRVELSIPIDDEKIFADYLPYAFAFDMENKWMKRFEKVLSEATIERHMHNIGGRSSFLRSGFIVAAINASAPRSSGSSGRSGSGGGGRSGGGRGGGGGGGR